MRLAGGRPRPPAIAFISKKRSFVLPGGRKMISKAKIAWAGAAAALIVTAHGQALADDALFDSWSTVAEDTLDLERGRNVDVNQDGGALAINIGIQTVTNTINGDATGGNITLMPNALDGQRMVINAFNAGNNVSMLNQLSIAVDLTSTTPAN